MLLFEMQCSTSLEGSARVVLCVAIFNYMDSTSLEGNARVVPCIATFKNAVQYLSGVQCSGGAPNYKIKKKIAAPLRDLQLRCCSAPIILALLQNTI